MEVKKRKTLFTPYKKVNDTRVTIMWDYKPVFKTNAEGVEVETPLAVWQEYTFNHIPALEEIKQVVTEFYNRQIDQQIINGLVWKGMKVWLSTENQFNYKVAYDLAVQTGGATLPITFKFGDENTSHYYEFTSVEELTDFYLTSINYVQTVLKEGWKKKDTINWNIFQ
jgi:hypothetical protein